MKGSTRKYVDRKFLLCSTKLVYIYIYIYIYIYVCVCVCVCGIAYKYLKKNFLYLGSRIRIDKPILLTTYHWLLSSILNRSIFTNLKSRYGILHARAVSLHIHDRGTKNCPPLLGILLREVPKTSGISNDPTFWCNGICSAWESGDNSWNRTIGKFTSPCQVTKIHLLLK